MMGSAMSFPARDNGHEVRLVGIHNRENIESIRSSGYHPTLKRQLPDGVKACHLDGLAEALEGADVILCGVSSFGIEWFEENIVPLVPEGIPVLSITKGLEKDADGNLAPFPTGITERALARGQCICFNAVGVSFTSMYGYSSSPPPNSSGESSWSDNTNSAPARNAAGMNVCPSTFCPRIGIKT